MALFTVLAAAAAPAARRRSLIRRGRERSGGRATAATRWRAWRKRGKADAMDSANNLRTQVYLWLYTKHQLFFHFTHRYNTPTQKHHAQQLSHARHLCRSFLAVAREQPRLSRVSASLYRDVTTAVGIPLPHRVIWK